MSYGGDSRSPETQQRTTGWGGVAVAAILAAGLASAGTAAIINATDDPAAPSPGVTTSPRPGTPPSATPDPDNRGGDSDGAAAPAVPDWPKVAAQVRDTVVAIDVRTPRGESAGSGVIVDDAGSIITNAHVVGDVRQSAVIITLADGRMFEARVVGSDTTTDIAVVRLNDPPPDLQVATLGSTEQLAVGDPVLAVGNPLGLDSTATTGIVSALDRPVVTRGASSDDTVVTNAIQVDAAINPGNSGGPLFDARGQVIGINSSIATLSGGSEGGSIGLGFAIPIEQAQLVADQLMDGGVAEHAFLGVALSNTVVTVGDVTRQGAQIERVEPGSPAAGAGLRAGDVVVGIDGKSVDGAASLTGYVRQYPAGAEVTVDIVREGRNESVTAQLAVREVTN